LNSKSRRQFIWTSAAVLSTWGLHQLWRHSNLKNSTVASLQPRQFFGASYKTQLANSTSYDPRETAAFAFRIDERGMGFEHFPISVPAHTINPIPHHPHRGLAVSSRAPLASIIDWQEQKEVRRLELPNDQVLQGHVVFRQSGNGTHTALISASRRVGTRMADGRLIEVELQDLQIVKSHPVPSGFSHEMLAIDQDHIVMGMAGLQRVGSRFSVFDAVTGKSEKLPSLFEVDEWRGMAHFVIAPGQPESPRLSIWSSNTRDGKLFSDPALVFLDLNSMRADKFMFPEELKRSELLSMAYHPHTGRLWGTLPDLNRAFVFDVESRRLIKVLQFPYRVTFAGLGQLDPQHIVLGGGSQFSIWDADKIEKLDEQARLAAVSPQSDFNISHLREAPASSV
jgi:hypothetical protein